MPSGSDTRVIRSRPTISLERGPGDLQTGSGGLSGRKPQFAAMTLIIYNAKLLWPYMCFGSQNYSNHCGETWKVVGKDMEPEFLKSLAYAEKGTGVQIYH